MHSKYGWEAGCKQSATNLNLIVLSLRLEVPIGSLVKQGLVAVLHDSSSSGIVLRAKQMSARIRVQRRRFAYLDTHLEQWSDNTLIRPHRKLGERRFISERRTLRPRIINLKTGD